ncbi:MAG: DMT family transporter [Dehalococcoidia bacterium]|nr:MAG: DMT family transporter [Dehalococcoidia bacterium]
MGSKPYAKLLLGVISVSFAAIFIRLADAPPLVIAAYRMLIAACIITPIYMVRYRSIYQKVSGRDLLLVLVSAVLLAVHFGLWITSLEYTSIASSVVLATSHPIFVAILSYFLWKERLSKKVILGIILALVGVTVINWGGFILSSTAFIGNMLALLSAIAIGIHLIIGRQLKERVRLMQYLTTVYGGSALILAIAVLISGYSLIGYSANTYLMLILLALIPQVVGHSMLNQAVRLMSVTIVATAIVGEPIGAIIWGYLILGEGITAIEIVGSLLTLGGITTVVVYWHKAVLTKP